MLLSNASCVYELDISRTSETELKLSEAVQFTVKVPKKHIANQVKPINRDNRTEYVTSVCVGISFLLFVAVVSSVSASFCSCGFPSLRAEL